MPSRLRRLIPSRALALLVAGAGVAQAATASASPSVTLGGEAELEGTHLFDELVLSGLLRVPGKPGGNRLVLVANRVTINASGVLDATGAGAQGVDGGNGESPTGTVGGGGNPAAGAPAPGGGGGHAKNGLPGFGTACELLLDAGGNPTAGQAIDPLGMLFGPGGAGGAFVPPPFPFTELPPTRGGAGGGVIEIDTDVLVLDGLIRANGEAGPGSDYFAFDPTVSAGGGAGGSVLIRARVVSGSGTIEVKGGPGSGLSPGGGGSGGLVLVNTPDLVTFPITLDLSAGASGLCSDPDHDGLRFDLPMDTCVDKDGDGFGASTCTDGTGTDCDDADPGVHPEGLQVLERCDGVDNDCDGGVDVDLEVPCPDGTHCELGACTADVVVPPPKVPPKPVRLDFVGACALAAGSGTGSGGPGSAALLVLALGTVARRVSARRGGHGEIRRGPRQRR